MATNLVIDCVFYSEQELCVELSQLSPDKVNSVVEDVLSKRGVSYLEPLEDLRTKFNVRKIFVCYESRAG